MRLIEKDTSDLMVKIRTQITSISVLYDDSAAMLSQIHNTGARFPLFNQIDSCIYRERLKLPTTREELNSTSHRRKTIASQNFQIYTSTNNEFVIFGLDANIRMLSTKLYTQVDVTFKSVPGIYLQLLSIHVFEGENSFKLFIVYCLLKHVQCILRSFIPLKIIA